MATGQGCELNIFDISFQELLLDPYQDNFTLSSGSYLTGELAATGTSGNGENMNGNGNDFMQMSPRGEPSDLPHFDGSGGQSAPVIENAGDYHRFRSSVTHHDIPDTNNRHTHLDNGLTRRRSRAGQSELRRYLCPISSCSRNRTNSKRVLRSDNLGDHLRKVHKLTIPARTRIVSWMLTNSSLLREVDEQMQVLHGGSWQ